MTDRYAEACVFERALWHRRSLHSCTATLQPMWATPAAALRVQVVAVFMALVAAGCAQPEDSDGGSKEGGPMLVPPAHGSLVHGPMGTVVTDGSELLLLAGDEPATIVSVQSHGGEQALRFLGAMVAGPDRKLGAWTQLGGYPPRLKKLRDIVPAEGANITPRDETRNDLGYELLLGYEVIDDSEQVSRTSVEVVYEVGGERFRWVSPATLAYCPASMKSEECIAGADTGS